ncbi:c-type cytochrome [Maricaulis sp.]|uniref:c-type cytochrome n=1 Tax=Maricaulis sp. TaxID=1486257 RepID=UPI003A90F22C
MTRYLLPILAALTLSACGDGSDPQVTPSAGAQSPASQPPASAPGTGSAPVQLAALPGGPDLANGQRQFRRCQSCHTMTEGGRHTVGPNLYGVLSRPAASAPGFSYSRALRESGLNWDRETLDAWIENPRLLVPGNRMSFVGLRNAEDRRDVIAYIASETGGHPEHDEHHERGEHGDRDGHGDDD